MLGIMSINFGCIDPLKPLFSYFIGHTELKEFVLLNRQFLNNRKTKSIEDCKHWAGSKFSLKSKIKSKTIFDDRKQCRRNLYELNCCRVTADETKIVV